MSSDSDAILERLAALSEPYVFAPPWDFVEPDNACRRLMCDADEVVHTLQDEFALEQLTESHVLESDAEGTIALNPRLCTHEAGFVILRNGEGIAFEALTDEGCLNSSAASCLAIRGDATTRLQVEKCHSQACGVDSLCDLMLLRSLGVASIPARDLGKLSRTSLGLLADFRWHANATTGGDHVVENPRIEILAGSLSSATSGVSEHLCQVARRVGGAKKHLKMNFPGLSVWWPSVEELDGLCYFRELRDPAAMRNFLRQEHETYEIEEFMIRNQPPVRRHLRENLCSCTDDLLQTQRNTQLGTQSAKEQRRVKRKYDETLEREVIRPLIEEAMAATNPKICALELMFANMSREMLSLMPEVHAFLAKERTDSPACSDRNFELPQQWQYLDSSSKLMIKLVDQIGREEGSTKMRSLFGI